MKAFRIDQLENTDTLSVLFYRYVTVVLRLFKVSYFKKRLGVHTDNLNLVLSSERGCTRCNGTVVLPSTPELLQAGRLFFYLLS